MSSLRSGGVDVISQYFEYLDLPRNSSPEHRKVLAEMMRSRYSRQRIDMIITQYTEALQFLLNEGRTVFPEAPILAMYMFPRIELPKTGRLIIQHSTTLNMIGTLESALKLVPRAKRVYVVSGVSSVDRTLENQARRDFKKWEGQLNFRYLSDMSFEDMLSEVSSAPPGTIVLFIALTADITGKAQIPRDAVQRLSQVSKAPIFGLYDTLLGYGIAGGFLVDFEYIGTKAGELALNILTTGSRPDKTSAILDVPPLPMFDQRQLRHWNLSVDALPKGSIVINREFTLWDFRYYIIGALAFCLAETALIIFLIAQRRRKKVAEEELRQKKEELDQFFNITTELLCIADTDGYFLRLNPAWERTLGHTREELMGKRFFDFVHPDDLDKTRETVSILASQQKVTSFENRYHCKDGTYRWLEWSSAPAGKLIYACARDITERKQAEEALQNSEEKFRQFFKNCPDYCYIISTEGNILHINEAALKTLGYKREELFGQPLARIYAPESLAKMEDLFTQWKESGEIRDEEMVIVTRKGERRVVILNVAAVKDKDGTILHSTSVQMDITERKQMEETIKKDAEEWQTTFNSIRDLVMILDQEFKIARVNAATVSFFKLPLESILGNHCFTLMHGTSEPLEICPLAKMMKTKTHEETELYDERRDAWFNVSVDPIFNDKGETINIIHVVKDITERKRAEAEVAHARAELLRVERSSRLSELTASLAHELNQPLAAILSNAQAALHFLKSDKPDLNEFQEIMQDIISDDQRAGNVIRSLRSMMKREEGEKRPTILNDILNDVIQIFRSEAIFRNVYIETELDGSLPPVFGDKTQLQQVVLNIVMNGAEAMSRNPPEQRKLILWTQRKDHSICVTVRDFGPGIDKENLERVFQPFFTTKGAGFGMGLAVCSSIIKGHRGRIWAENNPDGGATFFIELPIYESGK